LPPSSVPVVPVSQQPLSAELSMEDKILQRATELAKLKKKELTALCQARGLHYSGFFLSFFTHPPFTHSAHPLLPFTHFYLFLFVSICFYLFTSISIYFC